MRAFRRFFSVYSNWLGLLALLDFAIAALLSPSLPPSIAQTPLLPLSQQVVQNALNRSPQPPSPAHPLGTLEQQEDILIDLVNGARQAFEFSLKVVFVCAGVGILLGASSAYLGGWMNSLVLRFSDAMLAVPVVVMIVMIGQIRNVMLTRIPLDQLPVQLLPGGGISYSEALSRFVNIDPILWGLILVGWIPYARLVNTMVTILKDLDYVQAARALGANPGRVVLRHLVPNSITPALVLLARDMGWVVILQATLAFAGFGATSEWGSILIRSRDWIIGAGGNPFGYWWVWAPATLALVVYGVAWNLVGDGLNDALNPRG